MLTAELFVTAVYMTNIKCPIIAGMLDGSSPAHSLDPAYSLCTAASQEDDFGQDEAASAAPASPLGGEPKSQVDSGAALYTADGLLYKYDGVIGEWERICKGTLQLHRSSDGGFVVDV